MRAAFALRIISGKNIYNFAILENLRIFQNCLFTGGVPQKKAARQTADSLFQKKIRKNQKMKQPNKAVFLCLSCASSAIAETLLHLSKVSK